MHLLISQALIAEDHFKNVPVGALSPSIEMQQKQQQNLLQRKTSLTNSALQSNCNDSNKQQKTSSFWSNFGIGSSKEANKQTTDKPFADNNIHMNVPTVAGHEESRHRAIAENRNVGENNIGMAPR